MEAEFGFRPRALVRTGADIRSIARAIPDDWTNGPTMRADVVYRSTAWTPGAAVTQLEPREGIEQSVLAHGAFIWMVDREDATRTG